MAEIFGAKIKKYQEDIIRDIGTLVAIPSVCGPAAPGMPYGEPSYRALECILGMARGMGFETKNVDGYAGHAEYGTGPEYAAVLSHVDVVPAGSGWDTDPFTPVRRGGLIYGRGTADDKGAAVVTLYCLKVLKDEGITGKRRLRAIFGAGEEIGMDDMPQYFSKEPLPEMAFTPDSEYGICNREKGILRFSVGSRKNDSGVVRKFRAGSVVNAVPDRAEAQIVCSIAEYENLKKTADGQEGTFQVERTPYGAYVTSLGKAAHAMQPQAGFNAAAHLVRLLARSFGAEALGGFLSFLDGGIGTETDGASMGVKQSDAQSGALTLNLGILNIQPDSQRAEIDIRYPVTSDGEAIVRTLKERVEKAGFTIGVSENTPPLYLPESSPLISLLSRSYQAVTGRPAELYSTGGGTYARTVKGRGVAFGPFFQDEPDRRVHNSNENIEVERFMQHAQICLEAMYRLMTE